MALRSIQHAIQSLIPRSHTRCRFTGPEQAHGPVSRGDSQPQPSPLVSQEGWDKFVPCHGWCGTVDIGHAGDPHSIA